MALWKKVQTLDETSLKAVHKYYEENFPIEVRNIFANFIEEQILGQSLDADNHNHFQGICSFIDSLIEQIEARAKSVEGDIFYIRQKLVIAADQFKRDYGSNQVGLFRIIKACLNMETSLAAPDSFLPFERDEILEHCKSIKDGIVQSDDMLRNVDQRQSDFESDFSHRGECDAVLNKLKIEANGGVYTEQHKALEKTWKTKKEDVDNKLQQNINTIIILMGELESHFAKYVHKINCLQAQILGKLSFWKYEQQQVANGAAATLKLEKVQLWCEELAEIIWSIWERIGKAGRIKKVNPVYTNYKDKLAPDTIPDLQKKIMSALKILLQEAFVVEEQPPQVMKQSTKFPGPITVRHLAGHKLNSDMSNSTVVVRLLEESMTKTLQEPNCVVQDRGGISTGSRALEYNKESRRYFTTFKNCQLKNFRRAEKKGVGMERVMEDKFCLYFETFLTVGEMKFKVWTVSLPSVVISHGSQEAQAVATITWDNGFGEINREPFVVPSRVPWSLLSQVLSHKFSLLTGRQLSAEHISTLEKKLFRGPPSEYVTWTEFCKDNMPGTSFSFWCWCFEIMKLIEKFLKGSWCEGSIMGIIERETAEKMLSTCTPGTFLARFSDSRLGAISISWIHADGKVYSVNPLAKNDLTTKGFADTVMDLEKLKFLYSGIPKADAFAKHRKPATPTGQSGPPNTYVKLRSDIDVPEFSTLEYGNGQWPYPASPAISSFSETDSLLATVMDTEPQQQSGHMDQFLESLITFPPSTLARANIQMNGISEQHCTNSNNINSEDEEMTENGRITEDVLQIFKFNMPNGIHEHSLLSDQNFTQL